MKFHINPHPFSSILNVFHWYGTYFNNLWANSEALLLTQIHILSAAKSLQSCPTLCDPIDGSPPGSPIPGILQARTLEWFAISFSSAWKWKVKVKLLSCVRLFTTPWISYSLSNLDSAFLLVIYKTLICLKKIDENTNFNDWVYFLPSSLCPLSMYWHAFLRHYGTHCCCWC